jgi:hypothetical protein
LIAAPIAPPCQCGALGAPGGAVLVVRRPSFGHPPESTPLAPQPQRPHSLVRHDRRHDSNALGDFELNEFIMTGNNDVETKPGPISGGTFIDTRTNTD